MSNQQQSQQQNQEESQIQEAQKVRLQDLKADCEKLEQGIETSYQDISNVENERVTLESSLQENIDKYDQNETELKQLETEINQKKKEIEQYSEMIEEQKKDESQKEKQKGELDQQIKKNDQEINKLETEKNNQISQIESHRKEDLALKDEIQASQRKIDAHQKKIKELEGYTSNEKVSQCNLELQSKLNEEMNQGNLIQKKKRVVENWDKCKTVLDAKEEELKKKNKMRTKMDTDMKDLKENIEQIKNKINVDEKHNVELKKMFDTASNSQSGRLQERQNLENQRKEMYSRQLQVNQTILKSERTIASSQSKLQDRREDILQLNLNIISTQQEMSKKALNPKQVFQPQKN